MADANLTILNRYELRGSVPEFAAAITALTARVQLQGHAGVLAYRFFVNPDQRIARAVVDYADAAAWIGHHDIAMAWPEMKALHAAAHLVEVVFLGEVTGEIRAWIANSSLKAAVLDGNRAIAGFRR